LSPCHDHAGQAHASALRAVDSSRCAGCSETRPTMADLCLRRIGLDDSDIPKGIGHDATTDLCGNEDAVACGDSRDDEFPSTRGHVRGRCGSSSAILHEPRHRLRAGPEPRRAIGPPLATGRRVAIRSRSGELADPELPEGPEDRDRRRCGLGPEPVRTPRRQGDRHGLRAHVAVHSGCRGIAVPADDRRRTYARPVDGPGPQGVVPEPDSLVGSRRPCLGGNSLPFRRPLRLLVQRDRRVAGPSRRSDGCRSNRLRLAEPVQFAAVPAAKRCLARATRSAAIRGRRPDALAAAANDGAVRARSGLLAGRHARGHARRTAGSLGGGPRRRAARLDALRRARWHAAIPVHFQRHPLAGNPRGAPLVPVPVDSRHQPHRRHAHRPAGAAGRPATVDRRSRLAGGRHFASATAGLHATAHARSPSAIGVFAVRWPGRRGCRSPFSGGVFGRHADHRAATASRNRVSIRAARAAQACLRPGGDRRLVDCEL